jgi:hypothetical protein
MLSPLAMACQDQLIAGKSKEQVRLDRAMVADLGTVVYFD